MLSTLKLLSRYQNQPNHESINRHWYSTDIPSTITDTDANASNLLHFSVVQLCAHQLLTAGDTEVFCGPHSSWPGEHAWGHRVPTLAERSRTSGRSEALVTIPLQLVQSCFSTLPSVHAQEKYNNDCVYTHLITGEL